jgi:hypothetical protein
MMRNFKRIRRIIFAPGLSLSSNKDNRIWECAFTARLAPIQTDHKTRVTLISSAQENDALNTYLAITCIKQIDTTAASATPMQ